MTVQTQTPGRSSFTALSTLCVLGNLFQTATDKKVHTGEIEGLDLDTAGGRINLGVAPKDRTNGSVNVPFKFDDMIANREGIDGLDFYQCTKGAAQHQGTAQAIKQIAAIPGANGQPTHSVHASTKQIQGRFAQCVLVRGQDDPIVLNPVGKPGVSDVRVSPKMNIVTSMLLNANGGCVGFGLIKETAAQARPESLVQHKIWPTQNGMPANTGDAVYMSKARDNGTVSKHLVTFEGGHLRELIVTKAGHAFHMIWGKDVFQLGEGLIALGYVEGQENVIAVSQPHKDSADIFYLTLDQLKQAGNTVAANYLMN